MKYFLGIDGGGTKTKFTICDENGSILAENIQPTCHYHQCGFEGMKDILRKGIREAAALAGCAPEQIAYAFVGCPGYGDSPESSPKIQAAVAEALAPIPHHVGNDCENALAGGLAGACGINLICGTGSMGCGRNAAGQVLRCGGWHHSIGSDEGSGYWIGLNLITQFTRQSDGRAPRTPLYCAIRDFFSLKDDGDIIPRVVEDWNMDRTKIASLTRLVPPLLEQKDSAVIAILEQAADELAKIAISLYQQLQFSQETPVSYTGGVFNLGEVLLTPLRTKLAAHHMQLALPQFAPDVGSLILALQAGNVPITQKVLDSFAKGIQK